MPIRMKRGGSREAPDARFYEVEPDGRLLCTLCPRYCRLSDGQAGFCFIRQNQGGTMKSLGYGRPTGFAIDPVEKKPLNHFLPGTPILSFGTAGCNLGCQFCQNWDMSKARIDTLQSYEVTPEEVVDLAIREGCPSIAFTYNDPVIFAEFVIDVSRIARERGVKSVLVTAGYVTPEARPELYRYADAANVDLKAFTEEFYRKATLSHLAPVLDTLVWLRKETEVWTEITTLLIPGKNDGDEEIQRECAWIVENLGEDQPIHFTAFHPDYRMTGIPGTPAATVRRARAIARAEGLKYVYVGNVHDSEGQTTWCPNPSCGEALIVRDWQSVRHYHLQAGGRCPSCGATVPGIFESGAATTARRGILPSRVTP
ncbi:MAG: AmmeMemoRadiSam system radical SAM enzyme [Candidatus Eisenbacteria bacterium]|nr:AmmeMemoRadiSam system radical SAM enzyme [Candidatus Eisenbacteria bacterium]